MLEDYLAVLIEIPDQITISKVHNQLNKVIRILENILMST